MCTSVIEILTTVIGGLVLTFILFLLNEYCFRKLNYSGEWKVIINIKESSYNPFKNLKIEYNVHLLQRGYDISGSGEKIKEQKEGNPPMIYQREKRVIIKIEGYYERKYLSKSKIYLTITENGKLRESRGSYEISRIKNELKGTFTWTAGDARGVIIMTKNEIIK